MAFCLICGSIKVGAPLFKVHFPEHLSRKWTPGFKPILLEVLAHCYSRYSLCSGVQGPPGSLEKCTISLLAKAYWIKLCNLRRLPRWFIFTLKFGKHYLRIYSMTLNVALKNIPYKMWENVHERYDSWKSDQSSKMVKYVEGHQRKWNP